MYIDKQLPRPINLTLDFGRPRFSSPLALYLAFKEIWRSKGRFFLVSLVIALITVLVLFIAGLAEGLGAGNREYLEKLNILEQLIQLGDSQLLAEIAAEAERLAREVFARNDSTRSLLAELDRQKERLTRLEDLYLDEDIDKSRYLQRKAEIDQIVAELEDKLYAATQTLNFSQVLTRMTSTLKQLPEAPPETKKTVIDSMIERLDVGGGKVIRLTPRPWARSFF